MAGRDYSAQAAHVLHVPLASIEHQNLSITLDAEVGLVAAQVRHPAASLGLVEWRPVLTHYLRLDCSAVPVPWKVWVQQRVSLHDDIATVSQAAFRCDASSSCPGVFCRLWGQMLNS